MWKGKIQTGKFFNCLSLSKNNFLLLIGHKQNTRCKENDENLDPAERISFSDCPKKRNRASYKTRKILFKYEGWNSAFRCKVHAFFLSLLSLLYSQVKIFFNVLSSLVLIKPVTRLSLSCKYLEKFYLPAPYSKKSPKQKSKNQQIMCKWQKYWKV